MMLRRVLGVTLAGLAAGVVCSAGCSSSTGTPGGASTGDSGTAQDSSTKPDTSTSGHDSGAPAADTGSGSPGDSGGDAGAACAPPASVASFTPATYVASVGHQGVCSAAQITTFVSDCGFDNGTPAACQTWQTANVGTGDAGNACGNCIMAPGNNGGLWFDPEGMNMAYNGLPNYAGCIQLTDATHGTACATAFNNVDACDGVACDMACANASQSGFDACASTVNAAGCSTYNTAYNSSCSTDFDDAGDPSATVAACFPAANSGDPDDDYTYIITLICGGATADAGGAGG